MLKITLARFCKYALMIATLVSSSLAFAAAKPGQAAPDFSLPSASGDTVKLSDYQGKYVVLEWTNHDCPFVKKHYGSGNMQALQKQYTGEDVVWLSIISSAPGKQGNVSATEAMTLTKSRNAHPTHVLLDSSGDVGKAYGAKTTPHIYVITPQGELAYMGAIDSIKSADPADIPKADNYLQLAMADLSQGKAVAQPLTKPYGCSVKY
ncbi:thioredoxin family protein [Corallincola luteus]|uniref:Thioredoxin family protein n=1 Tax=Corallincola luteus TaxID=1775177 RepID=A0ABY2AJF5_9GAMM|nr:thioredoxin family protein [Corallincola luteus]TCI02936.1 thioredoxin family protein [Corallincola luteus]